MSGAGAADAEPCEIHDALRQGKECEARVRLATACFPENVAGIIRRTVEAIRSDGFTLQEGDQAATST